MAWVDVLVFLIVGAFVVSRFFSHRLPTDPKDGRKDGKPGGWGQLGKDLSQRVQEAAKTIDTVAVPKKTAKAGVPDGFDEAAFLSGAKAAYRYYHDRWNAKDEDGLAKLCSPELMDTLNAELNKLDKRGVSPLIVVNSLDATLAKVSVKAKTAVAEVVFDAVQSEDEVNETNPKITKTGQQRHVRTKWTFARPITSDDPNWDVVSINPAEVH